VLPQYRYWPARQTNGMIADISANPDAPRIWWLAMFIVVSNVFRLNRMDRALTVTFDDSFQSEPRGNSVLGLLIKTHRLAFNHGREDGLRLPLDISHPATVAVLADALSEDCGLFAFPKSLFSSVIIADMLTHSWHPSGVLSYNLISPLGDNILLGRGRRTAEDASLLGWWYDFTHDSHASAETEDPEGPRNPCPQARGRSPRSQESGEGQALNSEASPEEVASQTERDRRLDGCIAKHIHSGSPEDV
jgi:hypothetical protein